MCDKEIVNAAKGPLSKYCSRSHKQQSYVNRLRNNQMPESFYVIQYHDSLADTLNVLPEAYENQIDAVARMKVKEKEEFCGPCEIVELEIIK